jgi:hypothetical protein
MTFSATPDNVLLLALLVITLPLTVAYVLRARSGRLPVFRPLPGLAGLRALFSDVAESGRPLHIATGAGRRSGVGATAETIASLLIAQRIAEETVQRGGNVSATSGDIVSHAALRGSVHQAYVQAGFASDYQPSSVQLVSQHEPVAYAAGVAARYATEPMAASVVAGNYDVEALLITTEGAAHDISHVAATTSFGALPVLAISADATLVGEELFAAEAYLSDSAAPKARLLTQDALRWTVLALLIGALIWQALAASQLIPALPPLA